MAPLTAAIVYVLDEPSQTLVLPEIAPGVASVLLNVIARVCAAPDPQELMAATVMFPHVVLAVVVMLLVVEEPVHAPGNVHEYDVASLTALML